MCPTGIANTSGKKEKHSTPIWPAETFVRIVREGKELSGMGLLVSFSGGEPMFYKPLYYLIQLSRDLGIDFSFTTNGYQLNEINVKKIVNSGLFNIGISLEAIDPDINEILRPVKNGTKKTIQGIERLLLERESKKFRISINIKCTLTQVNFHAIIDIVKRYGKTKGVIITPQPFNNWAGDLEVANKLWIKDIEGFKKTITQLIALKRKGYSINADEKTLWSFVSYFESGLQNGFFKPNLLNKKIKREDGLKNRCKIGCTTLFIDFSGNVKMCPFMKPIGNINNGLTLKQLWKSDAAHKIRKIIRNCDLYCNLSCTREKSLLDKIILYLRR